MSREGYKMTEVGEIPDDWDVKKLIDVCKKPQYGYTQSATDRPIGPNFLRITDIQNGNVNWDEVPYCYCPKDEIDKYLLESGDVLFARTGATTGKSYLIKECPKTVFASYLIRVKSKKTTDSKYLFMFFNSDCYWRQINEKIMGSAQGGLNATTLSSLQLPFPPLPEQQKIAAILSTLDATIEHTETLIDKYRDIKKGLMADLLTRGIDENGRIRSEETHRFKDSLLGRVPQEWYIKTLKEIGQIITGNTPDTKVDEYYNGNVLFASPVDIGTKKYICNTAKKISHLGFQQTRAIPPYSIMVTCIGALLGKVGIAKKEMATNQQINTLVLNQKIANYDFVYYLIVSMKSRLELIAGLQAIPIVNKSMFSRLKVSLPSLPEQQKIASILSSTDERIEKEESYRDKLLQLKKAMMQDLLTGQVRVKV